MPRPALPSGDTARGLRRAPRVGAHALRRPLGGRVVAAGVRRPRREPVGVAASSRRSTTARARRSASPRTASSCSRRRSSSSARRSRQDRILPAWPPASRLWCQGWSEPNAGSDLAGIQSRAVRDEAAGGWRLSGQKTWTTRGAFCTHLFGLFRSDPDGRAPPRASRTSSSTSSTPGVTVRPVGRLDGDEGFAEVFLDDVFVPDARRARRAERGLGRRDGDHRIRARAHAALARALHGHRRAPDRPVPRTRPDELDAAARERLVQRVDRRRGVPLADLLDRHPRRRGRRAGRGVEHDEGLLVGARRASCTSPRSTSSARTPSCSTATTPRG